MPGTVADQFVEIREAEGPRHACDDVVGVTDGMCRPVFVRR